MAKRKSITKKTRFEVFKRDAFTCQYCGRTAPEVVLEVDHINPVANGGDNELMNLITSCYDCNRGKGKRTLSDREELKKQQQQLNEINKQREQLKMLLEWKNELMRFNDEQIDIIQNLFKSAFGITFTEHGRKVMSKEMKRYGFDEVYESANISINQYDDASKAFDYVARICETRKQQRENPILKDINKIIAVAKNRCPYFNVYSVKDYLRKHITPDDVDEVMSIASTSRNYSMFKQEIEEYFGTEGEI
jgi:hypothetical protein